MFGNKFPQGRCLDGNKHDASVQLVKVINDILENYA